MSRFKAALAAVAVLSMAAPGAAVAQAPVALTEAESAAAQTLSQVVNAILGAWSRGELTEAQAKAEIAAKLQAAPPNVRTAAVQAAAAGASNQAAFSLLVSAAQTVGVVYTPPRSGGGAVPAGGLGGPSITSGGGSGAGGFFEYQGN